MPSTVPGCVCTTYCLIFFNIMLKKKYKPSKKLLEEIFRKACWHNLKMVCTVVFTVVIKTILIKNTSVITCNNGMEIM